MQPGRLVFPIIMAAVGLFFFAFVLTTPVNEAVGCIAEEDVCARDGDSLRIEFTAYYGTPGSGKAFFTTQEERAASLPKGDIAPTVQDDPIPIHLSPDEPAGGLRANLLGKREGDSFTTPAVPPAQAFGDWQGEKELPRQLAELTYKVRFDSQVQVGSGQSFNTTQYLDFWKSREFDLAVGSTWPCEGADLWDCRVDEISLTENVFAYSRLVKVGETYPVAPIWGNLPTGGDMSWDVSIQSASTPESFSLRLDPPVGTRFQFLQNAGGPFVAGTYLVKTLDAETIRSDYSPETPSTADLIGATVYYDIEIVSITRR